MISGIWSSCLAQGTIYVSGTYTGKTIWSADTVKVTGNVSVDTLFIEPGTVVEFQGKYGLNINKYLDAHGESGDTILFTVKDTTGFSNPDVLTGGWGGISGMAEFTLKYCKLQYVKHSKTARYAGAVMNLFNSLDIQHSCITNNITNGIYKESGKLNISNSSIIDNKGKGILDEVNGMLKVQACIFRNNSAGGIHSYADGELFVENSTIEFNGDFGIRASEPNMLYIDNNMIQNNNGSGIVVHDLESPSRGIVSNNILKFNNGFGFKGDICGILFVNNLVFNNNNAGIRQDMGFGAGSIFINNTIIKNSNGIEIVDAPLYMYNCICRDNNKREGDQNIKFFQSNQGKIYNNNIEGFNNNNYLGEFVNNMDLDPRFSDTANFDFRLSDSSPCINTGTPDTTGLYLPETDIEGMPRITNGWIDMGAYESLQFPYNQPPVIEWIQDLVILPGKTKSFSVKYMDPDSGDQSFVLSVSSDIPQIKIQDTIDNSTSVSFRIVSDRYWQGDGQIQIKISDNHGNIGIRKFHVLISKKVCGAIFENTVWDADTIKVTCDVTVVGDATLTIKPGTIVEFANNCLLNVYGSIIASGNKDSMIIFTSSDTTGFYNQAYTGWKGINLNGYKSAEFRYCNFLFAIGEKYGGALFDGGGTYPLKIANCIFTNNYSKEHGGAVYLTQHVSEFKNNVFVNNHAEYLGGAVYLDRIDIDIINNLFYNNQAEIGAAVYAIFGTVRLINNTIAENKASKIGGGAKIYQGKIINCIFWGNKSGTLNDQVAIEDSVKVGNCIIEGGVAGITYTGSAPEISDTVYSNDPAFVNKDLYDFHLTGISAGINSGTADTTGLNLPDSDLDGNLRILEGRIDIGAYEYHKENLHILKQPVSQVRCPGTAATLETEAIGGVIHYQWQKNGVSIPSANQRRLNFDSVSQNDSGYYNCLIIADDKTVSTDTVILTVPDPEPPVTNDVAICEGQQVPDLVATGDSITWYSNADLTNIVYSGNNFKTGLSDPGVYVYYVSQTVSGCVSTAGMIKLTINRLPVISLGKDSTISTNQNFILGPYPDIFSFLWNDNSENHSFEVSGNDLGAGSHTITVLITDSNTCQNSDTMIVHVVPVTHIDLTQNNNLLHIFPNPTDGLLNVELSDFHEKDIIITLYNQQGGAMMSNKLYIENKVGTIQLNISSYPAGIYYLQILTNKKHYFGKVIRQ